MTQLGRVLILGAAGQLGLKLRETFAGSGEIIAYDRNECDLSNFQALKEAVRKVSPDIILNAAAYTAVDRAESERELATAVNAIAPGVLAEEARQRDALLIHYSTDYVFDGSKNDPWLETDPTQPLNHYGASKLAGEHAVEQVGGKFLIFRTSWVYGPQGKNFVYTMLRLGREKDRITVVDDQFGAPTSSAALATSTRTVINGIAAGTFGLVENWAGVYHMTCAGVTTWCGFAREIFAQAERLHGHHSPEVVPISSESWPTPAKRPRNSILGNNKLQAVFGITLPHWKDELAGVFPRLHL